MSDSLTTQDTGSYIRLLYLRTGPFRMRIECEKGKHAIFWGVHLATALASRSHSESTTGQALGDRGKEKQR